MCACVPGYFGKLVENFLPKEILSNEDELGPQMVYSHVDGTLRLGTGSLLRNKAHHVGLVLPVLGKDTIISFFQ